MVKNKTFNNKAYNYLLLSCVLWGFQPLVYSKSLAVLSILVFLGLRYTIGAATLFALGRKHFVALSVKNMLAISLIVLVEVVFANFLYSYGIQRTTLLHAAIIQLSIPFLVYIFAAIMLKEKIHKAVIVGGAVAAIGLLVIMMPSSSSRAAIDPSLLGDLAMLGQTVFTALAIVLARQLLSKTSIPSGQFGFMEYGLGAVFIWAILIATGSWQSFGSISPTMWIWVLAAGTIVGAIPTKLYNHAARRLNAERLADGNFIIPIVASLVGIVVLNEAITVNYMVGALFVVAGLMISHDKMHPVYVAHRLNIRAQQLISVYRKPEKAYQYIRSS